MAEVSTPFVCLGKILIQVRVNLRACGVDTGWGLLGDSLKTLQPFSMVVCAYYTSTGEVEGGKIMYLRLA